MSDSTSRSLTALRVILFLDSNAWVAQGLELDIAAQGKDIAETKACFMATFSAEYDYCKSQGKEMRELIGPAPSKFEAWFGKALHSETVTVREAGAEIAKIEFAATA